MQRVDDFLAHQVATRPKARAFADATGHSWTYAAFDDAVSEMEAHLIATGLKPGDRVMILSENCLAAVAAIFAALRLRAIAVPVNARQSPAEVDKIIAHAKPAALILTTQISPDAMAHAERLGAELLKGGFGEVQIGCPFGSNPDADSEDVAILLYTTGTTGEPKGVMLTHANVRFGGMTSATLRGMTQDDVVYGVLPITHVFGLCSVVVAAVSEGAFVRLEPRFDVAKLYDALRDGVTLFSGVPQMHAVLMAHVKGKGLAKLGSETLRYVSSGAAPLDPTWKREAEAFYNVAIQNGYGMTETTAGISATRNPIGVPDVSVGPALPAVELRIDESLPGGGDGEGEVLTRGPHVMKGYYRNLEATDEVLDANGWMRTGDLGKFDDAGFLHILGRSKELIIHGGFNVYPPEVEAALNDHPDIVQAAVIGRRIAGDEEVLAFCMVSDTCTLTEGDLCSFVKDRLAGYKRPKRIILAKDLPAAPTGKILKHRLLNHFADQL